MQVVSIAASLRGSASSITRRGRATAVLAVVGLLAVGVIPRSVDAYTATPIPFGQGQLLLRIPEGAPSPSFVGALPGEAIEQPFGLPGGATPDTAARFFLDTFGPLLSIDDSSSLTTFAEKVTADGFLFARYGQSIDGLPVLGADLIVTMDDSRNVLALQGKVVPDTVTLPLAPPISSATAELVGTLWVADATGVPAGSLTTTDVLLSAYVPSVLGHPSPLVAAKAWQMVVESAGGEVREFVVVDAVTGIVLLSFSLVETAKEYETYDAAGGTSVAPPPECTEIDPSCSASLVPEARAAHIYVGTAWDYFDQEHGADATAWTGGPILSAVRVGGPASMNAFWTGTFLVFGQGGGFEFAQDVVAHELTHAFTQATSGLIYFGESGAINESLSDLWGELIDEHQAVPGSITSPPTELDGPVHRWLLGEDSTNGAARDMEDPPAFGDPDRMTAPEYQCNLMDNGGVHTNSGVNNKAVSLMSDGGSFNGETVTGIGYAKASALYYELQTNRLFSSADYGDLCEAISLACDSMAEVGAAGITPADCVEVDRAVAAVEMCFVPVDCLVPDVALCPAGQSPVNLFFDDIESGGGSWSTYATSGVDEWHIPQTSAPPPFNFPIASSGTGNIWSLDQGGLSESYAEMDVDILVPTDAYAHFNHAHDFHVVGGQHFGGGVLEYSTNGGSSWTDAGPLMIDNGYNGALPPVGVGGGTTFDGDAFVASSDYRSTRVDLGALAGQSVRPRFGVGTDFTSNAARLGWAIDDVRIYTCQASPTACGGTQTKQSAGSGDWSNPATWQPAGVPDAGDTVGIAPGHVVSVDADSVLVTSLCNEGTLRGAPGRDLLVRASAFISNSGVIEGADGADGSGPDPGQYAQPTRGRDVRLVAADVSNHPTGDIQAGRGGHARTFESFTGMTIDAVGAAGGAIDILGLRVVNEGRIGPDVRTPPGPLPANVDGGSGGDGDNFDSTLGANGGDTFGGSGGRTVVQGLESVVNLPTGYICSGSGGIANFDTGYTGVAGSGGAAVFTAPTTQQAGTLCAGGDGTLVWEPGSAQMTGTASIGEAQDISIFGGTQWTMDLRNLAPGAVVAAERITIAQGAGSTLDLRGNTGVVFEAGTLLEIFADEVLLEPGTVLEDLTNAPQVDVNPAKVLYDAFLVGPSRIDGEVGIPLSIPFEVANNGPAGDLYTFALSDEEGWTLGEPPVSMSVAPLSREGFEVEVTPSTNELVDRVTVEVSSVSDPSVTASAVVEVHLLPEPETWLGLVVGGTSLGLLARRRSKSSRA